MNTSSINLEKKSTIHAVKFALWLGCASITMMFVALTSAYLVREAGGNWLEFNLPNAFYFSTALIFLSSITLKLGFISFKKENFLQYKFLLVLTLILGVGFIIFQIIGWQSLRDLGITMSTNPSGSFIYVISGLHVAHVIGGIGALLLANIHAFSLPNVVTEKRLLRFQLTSTYWHFVDFLWIYLLIFFMVSQSL